jgi:hypothetical protein
MAVHGEAIEVEAGHSVATHDSLRHEAMEIVASPFINL